MTRYGIHHLLFYLTGVGQKPLISSDWVETNAHRKPVSLILNCNMSNSASLNVPYLKTESGGLCGLRCDIIP